MHAVAVRCCCARPPAGLAIYQEPGHQVLQSTDISNKLPRSLKVRYNRTSAEPVTYAEWVSSVKTTLPTSTDAANKNRPRAYDKRQACAYCRQTKSKLSSHLFVDHSEEAEVKTSENKPFTE